MNNGVEGSYVNSNQWKDYKSGTVYSSPIAIFFKNCVWCEDGKYHMFLFCSFCMKYSCVRRIFVWNRLIWSAYRPWQQEVANKPPAVACTSAPHHSLLHEWWKDVMIPRLHWILEDICACLFPWCSLTSYLQVTILINIHVLSFYEWWFVQARARVNFLFRSAMAVKSWNDSLWHISEASQARWVTNQSTAWRERKIRRKT